MASNNLVITTAIFLIHALIVAVAEEIPRANASSKLEAMSFYDVVGSNGLPIGIFPKGISDFSFDPASGQFLLHLLSDSPCDTLFETRVRYEREIAGRLSYGKIANLSGVSAEELFLWLPVKGIQVDVPSSGLIYFDVEVVSKQFSLSLFETPKDCNSVEDGDAIGGNSFVSFSGNGNRLRISENPTEKYMRKRFVDQEERADS